MNKEQVNILRQLFEERENLSVKIRSFEIRLKEVRVNESLPAQMYMGHELFQFDVVPSAVLAQYKQQLSALEQDIRDNGGTL